MFIKPSYMLYESQLTIITISQDDNLGTGELGSHLATHRHTE